MSESKLWYVIFEFPGGRKLIHWSDTTRAKARHYANASRRTLAERGNVSPFKILVTQDRTGAE